MDMSLDDIIKSKKIAQAPSKKFKSKKPKARASGKKLPKSRAQASSEKFKANKTTTRPSKNKSDARTPSKKFEAKKPVQLTIDAKMDMSLDDIIRNEKISQAPSKKLQTKKSATRPSGKRVNKPHAQKPSNKFVSNKRHTKKELNKKAAYKKTQSVTDVRFKIVEKNRTKIRDARDILNEKTHNKADVRKQFMQKRNLTTHIHSKTHSGEDFDLRKSINSGAAKPIASGGLRRSHHENHFEISRHYVDYDNMEKLEQEKYAALSLIRRTFQNNIAYDFVPPITRSHNSWEDPFNVYEAPHPSHRQSYISPLSNIMHEHSSETYAKRIHSKQASHFSYEVPSRLERPLSLHTTMRESLSSGYRIIVSNLHTSVTQSDIKELFEDIGELLDSRIVRPGIAEIVYKSLSDAQKAIDTYHDRLLDNQPMKCLLINPGST